MARSGIWTREFVLVNLSKLLISLVFSLLTTVLVSYVTYAYGFGEFEGGITVGAFIIAALVSRVFIGNLISKIGRTKLLLAGIGLYAASSALYCVPMIFPALIAVRIAHGIAFGISTNILTVLATSCIPRERRGEGLGIFALSATIASAIGPFLGVTLANHISYEAMFVACAVSGVGSFVSSSALCRLLGNQNKAENRPATSRSSRRGQKPLASSTVLESKAVPLCILVMVLTICSSSVNTYTATFSAQLGFPLIASWFFVVYSATMLIARPVTGRIHDTHGARVVVIPCLASFGLGLIALSTCDSEPELLAAAVLIAIGYGGVFSSTQASIIGESDSDRIDAATSTFYVFGDVGLGVGPMIAGAILPFIGYRGMFGACAVAIAFGIVYYAAISKKKERP